MSIDKVLGQKTAYPETYDPEILVREARLTNRITVGLDNRSLPFKGVDVWNAYEVSGLTARGVPVVGVCKIVYPCESEYIVESKSLKLYFNSFNMYNCGGDPWAVRAFIQETAAKDLSELLRTKVLVTFFPSYTPIASAPIHLETSDPENSNGRYHTLEELYIPDSANVYKEDPKLLIPVSGPVGQTKRYHSALLKSNCKVTEQPDWGDIYIRLTGADQPTPESLLQYIISFRDECHFHEEICETIYQRLFTLLTPMMIEVTCLYARRGGIDINPTRYSDEGIAPRGLINPTMLHTKTLKQ
jgi:7-cyano-7-deazaguanine reductase